MWWKKTEKRRVAGYARVSTDKDDQFASYEAQIDYYTKYIQARPDWEFVKVYTDEGVTGTCVRLRPGFNAMINDALEGRIDLIVTKSISRFARNTVDSLTAIRRLKEAGCECFFEKENIYTFDGKGELMITIMSSLAQEESRSISENVTWGMRKRFADGQYVFHYSEFLGYRKGSDGAPKVDRAEARTVRRIYQMCLQGMSLYSICKKLEESGEKTPSGKSRWYYNVVKSILTNEKYIGDALLQKTFSISFLTKKRKPNNGEIPQYYVKNGHPAIISESLFRRAGKMLENMPEMRFTRADRFFSKRIKCGVCGNWYNETTWHRGASCEKRVWRCGKKFRTGNCGTPNVTCGEAQKAFDDAFALLCGDIAAFSKALSKMKTPQSELAARRCEMKLLPEGETDRLHELERELELRNALNGLCEKAEAARKAGARTAPEELAEEARTLTAPDVWEITHGKYGAPSVAERMIDRVIYRADGTACAATSAGYIIELGMAARRPKSSR